MQKSVNTPDSPRGHAPVHSSHSAEFIELRNEREFIGVPVVEEDTYVPDDDEGDVASPGQLTVPVLPGSFDSHVNSRKTSRRGSFASPDGGLAFSFAEGSSGGLASGPSFAAGGHGGYSSTSDDAFGGDDEPRLAMTDDVELSGDEGGSALQAKLRYLRYYFPIAMWLPNYDFKTNFLKDMIAGLSIGAMMVPQSMAYASIVGVSPMVGLATAVWGSLIYFFIGGSRVLTTGPDATVSMLLGHTVLSIPAIAEAKARGEDVTGMCLIAAAAITFMIGISLLVFGIFRLGFVDSAFSRPVLSGLASAIGIMLIVDQIPKLLGMPTCKDCGETYSWKKVRYLFREIFDGHIEYHTAIFALCCVAFLIASGILKKKFPKSKVLQFTPFIFILVICSTAVTAIFSLDHHGVKILGKKATGFPSPRLPQLNYQDAFSTFATSGVLAALLGFVHTHMINKVVPESGNVSPNRELIALGTMAMFSSLFGGFAPNGTFTRTKVAASAGATSQFACLAAGFIALISMLFLMPLFEKMPMLCPASIVFYVGYGLIDTDMPLLCYRLKQWTDLSLSLGMIAVCIIVNVEIGIIFAFAACLLLMVKQQKKPSVRLVAREDPHAFTSPRALHAHAHAQDQTQQQQQQQQPRAQVPAAGSAGASAGGFAPPALGRMGSVSVSRSQKVAFASDTPLLGNEVGHDSGAAASSSLSPSSAARASASTAATAGAAAGAGSEGDDASPYYELEERANLHAESLDGVLIYQVDGPLFFANAEGLKERTRRVEYFGSVASHPSEPMRPLALKGIVFDLTAVTAIDSTAAQVMLEIVSDYKQRGVLVYLVRLRKALWDQFVVAGIIKALGPGRILSSVDTAVLRIKQHVDASAEEEDAGGVLDEVQEAINAAAAATGAGAIGMRLRGGVDGGDALV